jgi:hypothetical protein
MLDTLLREVIESRMDGLSVALPATVVSYDRASQSATVRLSARRRVRVEDVMSEEDSFEDRPDVYAVPVAWPSGGSSFFAPDLVAGDAVLLIACDSDFSAWMDSGRVSDPIDGRSHHFAHSYAIPGARPDSRPILRLSSDTVLAAGGQLSSVASAEAVLAILDAVVAALSVPGVAENPLTGTVAAGAITGALTTFRSSVASAYIKTGDVLLVP